MPLEWPKSSLGDGEGWCHRGVLDIARHDGGIRGVEEVEAKRSKKDLVSYPTPLLGKLLHDRALSVTKCRP